MLGLGTLYVVGLYVGLGAGCVVHVGLRTRYYVWARDLIGGLCWRWGLVLCILFSHVTIEVCFKKCASIAVTDLVIIHH